MVYDPNFWIIGGTGIIDTCWSAFCKAAKDSSAKKYIALLSQDQAAKSQVIWFVSTIYFAQYQHY